MTSKWLGKERRDDRPGRRLTDSLTCPFHLDHHDIIKGLQEKKLDKWIFTLFISSVAVLIILASTIFGYVATEALNSTRKIEVLQVNQNMLLKYFNLNPIEDHVKAKEILENGDKKSE